MPRSSKQGNDAAVQGTNDSSIVSKCSTATQGYFKDDFLRIFVTKRARRAPLINRGYYIRTRVIDDVLKQFLSTHHGNKNQIISLGAGFDSVFFRLHASGHLVNTVFYEVDFPDVVRRKASIIRNNPQLRQLLSCEGESDSESGIYMTSAYYHLLGVDLTDLHLLERCLKQTGVGYELPTLLLSECVLTYMEITSSNAVIQWASASFPNAVFLTYEQIHPDDAFGSVMQKHFEKLNSPLKAIQMYPTIKAHQQRFHTLGWQGTSAIDMNSYYYTRLPVKERQRIECLEPFDEFEEWHLKCSHYAVIGGCNGTCSGIMGCLGEDHQTFSTEEYPQFIPDNPYPSTLQTYPFTDGPPRPPRRFGHASALLSSERVIIFGGFGEAGRKHARLGDVVVLDLKTGNWNSVCARSGIQELGSRMHHTLTAISGGNRLFLFGGRSSPTRPTNSSLIMILNAEQQVKTEKPLNQDRQSVAGEISSVRCGIQTPQAQPSCVVSSANLEYSGRDDAADDCEEHKEGTELDGCGDEPGPSTCEGDCGLTSLESVDATSCEEVNNSLGYVRRMDGLRSDTFHSTCSVEPAIDCQSVELGRLSVCPTSQTKKASPVYSSSGMTVQKDERLHLQPNTTDTAKECFSSTDGSNLQTVMNGADSYGLSGLQSRTGSFCNQSQVCAEATQRLRTENQKTTLSPESLRNAVMSFPRKTNTAFHSEESGNRLLTRPKFFSYSYLIEMQNSDAPQPRWRHSAVRVNLNDRECVVIYGGRSTNGTVFGDCWLFDVSIKLKWEKLDLTGDQHPCSHSHTACVWQDTRMVITGGLGPNLQPLTSVHVIDLESRSCQEISIRPTLPPRYSHTAHVIGNRLLLVGGVSPLGSCRYTVAIIDLDTATWHLHSLPGFDVEHPLMVHNHTSELLTDTRIVILGGGGNCFSFGTHLNNTPVEIILPF